MFGRQHCAGLPTIYEFIYATYISKIYEMYIVIIIFVYYYSYVDRRYGLHWCKNMARDEDRKKFVELAEKRVQRALKDIKLIGNLSNRSNYSYTDADVKKIYAALKKGLDEMKARFDSKGAAEDETFKL